MLCLEWRAAPRRLQLQWMGGGSTTAIAAQPSNPAQVAALIGPPGRDGADGGIPLTIAPAAVALSGHRAVYVGVDGAFHYCQPDLTSRLCAGVTTGAAAQGAQATAQTGGLMEEPSWSWNPASPVWLGADGLLTQALPATGALCQIGTPVGLTALRIQPQFYALL